MRGRRRSAGITRRWLFGTVVWIVLILLLAEVGIVVMVRNSYYSSAIQSLEWRVDNIVNNLPSSALQTREQVAVLRSFVEEFNEKDKFELILVNTRGYMSITSSGFAPDNSEQPGDYLKAISDAGGYGSYVGRTAQGEHVVAVTQLFDSPIGDISGVRLVTSLTLIDRQIKYITLLISLAVLVILVFTLVSGTYFIRSIVLPIYKIGDTARTIASGDFEVRINNEYDDEIGDLCDRINEMAAGLSQTDRMKNEFISSVSHELRTPLTSIKGWADTLAAIGPGDEKTYKKGMKIIADETERLSLMVEDLLDFSRLQSGGLSVHPERLDIVAELTDAVLLVEQRCSRAGIAVEYEEPPLPVAVMGDSNRIKQVFTNILDNAIKYTERGGHIRVAVGSGESTVDISVADDGAGIDASDLPHLTERFFKAANSTTGSGIGLAVVKEIMQAHGGKIVIDSEIGQGTRVTLCFPLAAETPADSSNNKNSEKRTNGEKQ